MGPATTDEIDLRPAWRRLGLPDPGPAQVMGSAPPEVRSTLEVALADLKLESRTHHRGVLLAGAGLLVVLMALGARSTNSSAPRPVEAPPAAVRPTAPAPTPPSPAATTTPVTTELRGERTMRPLPKRTKLPKPQF